MRITKKNNMPVHNKKVKNRFKKMIINQLFNNKKIIEK